MQAVTGADRKLSLQCASCGYGVAGSVPPERCPMCGRPVVWNHTLWRPFSARTSKTAGGNGGQDSKPATPGFGGLRGRSLSPE
jgi:hypothetical protein